MNFVAVACSPRLLRTAYLLTRDHAAAEDLLQTALARSWVGRGGSIVDDPEPYVRKVIVNTYTSWWRRRWTGEVATAELPDRVRSRRAGRASRTAGAVAGARQAHPQAARSLIVLRYLDDLLR